jgi:hypothetical protein
MPSSSPPDHVDKGFWMGAYGGLVFAVLWLVTEEAAIGAAIGGPVIVGGLMYAMKGS